MSTDNIENILQDIISSLAVARQVMGKVQDSVRLIFGYNDASSKFASINCFYTVAIPLTKEEVMKYLLEEE